MLTYQEAKAILDKSRNGQKKLENNTYMMFLPGGPLDIAVRLHSTNVVTLHADGTYTLDSGGWRTVTTKDRINKYAPLDPSRHVYQLKGQWYIDSDCVGSDHNFYRIPFFDGIRFCADSGKDARCVNPPETGMKEIA
jgi:hypothetical protein